jgi:hypothetical protein
MVVAVAVAVSEIMVEEAAPITQLSPLPSEEDEGMTTTTTTTAEEGEITASEDNATRYMSDIR